MNSGPRNLVTISASSTLFGGSPSSIDRLGALGKARNRPLRPASPDRPAATAPNSCSPGGNRYTPQRRPVTMEGFDELCAPRSGLLPHGPSIRPQHELGQIMADPMTRRPPAHELAGFTSPDQRFGFRARSADPRRGHRRHPAAGVVSGRGRQPPRRGRRDRDRHRWGGRAVGAAPRARRDRLRHRHQCQRQLHPLPRPAVAGQADAPRRGPAARLPLARARRAPAVRRPGGLAARGLRRHHVPQHAVRDRLERHHGRVLGFREGRDDRPAGRRLLLPLEGDAGPVRNAVRRGTVHLHAGNLQVHARRPHQ